MLINCQGICPMVIFAHVRRDWILIIPWGYGSEQAAGDTLELSVWLPLSTHTRCSNTLDYIHQIRGKQGIGNTSKAQDSGGKDDGIGWFNVVAVSLVLYATLYSIYITTVSPTGAHKKFFWAIVKFWHRSHQ